MLNKQQFIQLKNPAVAGFFVESTRVELVTSCMPCNPEISYNALQKGLLVFSTSICDQNVTKILFTNKKVSQVSLKFTD